MRELGELCGWLYGDRRENIRPLIESQNPDLAGLDEVLQKEAAIDALRNGLPLQVAHDVSLGDERLFRQALQDAKYALQRATGTLTTGFQKEHQDLLRTAREIAEIADDLVAQMERKTAGKEAEAVGGSGRCLRSARCRAFTPVPSSTPTSSNWNACGNRTATPRAATLRRLSAASMTTCRKTGAVRYADGKRRG